MTAESVPMPGPGFEWRPAAWGMRLSATALEPFPHGWTTRSLPLGPGRSPAWGEVARAAGLEPSALVRLRQVHAAEVYRAVAPPPADPPPADIVVSDDDAVVVAVQAADCVPLLMADRHSGRVVAAHAGWRGTVAGVAVASVRALVGSDPEDGPSDLPSGSDPRTGTGTVAAIGPSIGPCCYRVGEEVRSAFGARWRDRMDGWFIERGGALYLDLWAANRDQLTAGGLDPARVFVSGLCTACHADWFFSYRRDGPGTGRQVGYIRSVSRQ